MQIAIILLYCQMQIVHFNTKYGSYDEAVSREDGLAVFAFLFKVSHVMLLRGPGLLIHR